jgi:hypothetical protein
MLLMCGPFVGDGRTGDRAERGRRMSAAQQERLRALEEVPDRTEEQEVELLTLAWFTGRRSRTQVALGRAGRPAASPVNLGYER